MYRLIVLFVGLIAAGPAWAVCPSTPGDCPSGTANNWTVANALSVTGAASLLGGGTHTGTFTGGTFSGITLSGTIAGNYTVSGNPTFSGIPIFSGTLKVGAGGAGNAAMTQNGTGNWTVNLGGTSSILNFKNSGGTSILQLGGSTSNITALSQLVLSPAGVWSGAANATNSMFYHNGTWSGTVSSGSVSLAFLQTTDTINASAADSLTLFTLSMLSGGAAQGNRHAALFTFHYTSTMASAGSNDTYTALNTKAIASANDGGTGLAPGTASGALFGTNPVVTLQSGATNWSGAIGTEIDTDIEAGASVMDKIGLQIVQVTADTVAGARDDVALAFNNQPTGPLGWSALISIGRQGGYTPLAATGWVMQFTPHLGVGTIAGGGGIDFTNFVPTTAFIRGNNFLIDPTGNITGNLYKVGSNQVVGARITGWGAASNGAKTAFNGSTATLAQTSAAVAQLIADLTTHGLIGP